MHSKAIKFALLIAGMVIQVCPQNNPVITGKWLARQLTLEQSRFPAQVAAPVCKGQLFTVEELRREAAHYEALLEGPNKPTGNWQHLSLSELPLAQARFLQAIGSKYGDMRAPGSLDVSACQNVPCIVNAVYGAGADIEGWAIYLWWLKTGTILSFKNSIYNFPDGETVPGSYAGSPYPLSAYLFDRRELYAFWRLSYFLPTGYKNLTNLKEFVRVPRGAALLGYGATTCGLASTVGYITLQDGCLKLGDFEDPNTSDRGEFYLLVIHEMTHILDNLMSGNPRTDYYSTQAEWLTIGGWSRSESLVAGVLTTTWASNIPRSGFVRDYAASTPIEHFADTSAYYRYNGEETKRVVPSNVYDKLKTAIFENEEFTPEGWNHYLRRQLERELAPRVFAATMECYQSTASVPVGPALGLEELPFTLEATKRRCLHGQRETLITQAMADLRLNTVDACSYLRQPARAAALTQNLRSWITAEYSNHLRQILADENYFEILTSFYQTIERGVVPVQMITECYGESDEGACYRQKVSEYIESTVSDSHANAERLRSDLLSRFLEAYRFETLRADMIKTFQDFLATQSTSITEAAAELWNRCASGEFSNRESPRGSRFSVGTGWMVSSQFNCLNDGVVAGVDSLTRIMNFDGEIINQEQERRILRDLAISHYLNELRRLYSEAKAQELVSLEESRGTIVALTSFLKGDLTWLRAFDNDVRNQCMARAMTILPTETRYFSADEKAALVAPACAAAITSTEFQSHRRNHPEMALDFHVRAYLAEVERLSRVTAAQCLEKFPNRGIVGRIRNRGRRNDCFVEGWNEINQRLLTHSQTQYNLTLPTATQAQMERDGRALRERIRKQLVGDITDIL